MPASPRSARPIRRSSARHWRWAAPKAKSVLIEATCNQVNQDGGYTGMTPADFRAFVETIAAAEGFDTAQPDAGRRPSRPEPVETSARR